MNRVQRARLSRGAQYMVLVVIVVVIAFTADWSSISKAFGNWDAAAAMFPQVITVGLRNTIIYAAMAFAWGLVGGVILALMKLSSVSLYRWLASIYIEFFRGIPALLVFVAFGYAVPAAFKVSFSIPVTVMIALGSVSAAYLAETIRAGIEAVPRGQVEAARSLGMSSSRTTLTVVIPQAFRIILPPLTNEVIVLTKDSSLVYLLGLSASQYELTKFGKDALNMSGHGNPGLTPVLVAGLCYLVITVPLGFLARWFESKTNKNGR